MTAPPSRSPRWVAAVIALAVTAGPSFAFGDALRIGGRDTLVKLNQRLAGRVIDYTDNHGCDRRMCSRALGEKRDLYVYVPPGYDGVTQFPGVLWLHGIGQDERNFLDIAEVFDAGIRAGTMPPVVIAAPDGSVAGRPALFNSGSFFINSRAGRFEDYVIGEVWPFLTRNYAIRPERSAHVIAGVSMGGTAAYNLAFKHRNTFGQVAGVLPGLDLRYMNCCGDSRADYDPRSVAARTDFRPNRVVARIYGVVPVREKRLLGPLVDYDKDNVPAFIARENPAEMLAAYDVRPNEFGLFAGYGTDDQLNIDAQVEHFRDVAAARGVCVTTVPVPGGQHDTATAYKLVPSMSRWLTGRIGSFTPPGYNPGAGGRAGPDGGPVVVIRRAGILPRRHVVPLADPAATLP